MTSSPSDQTPALFAYLDGKLTPARRDAVDERARRDPAFADEMAEARELYAALDAVSDGRIGATPEPPADFAAGVMVTLHARPNAIERLRDWLASDGAASASVLDAMLDDRLSQRQIRALEALASRSPEVAAAGA